MMISLAQMGSKAPQQGSEGWHQQRKGRITGSKPAGLFFELKSKEDMARIYAEWFLGKSPPPFDEEAIARMAWGTKYEDQAAIVLANSIKGAVFYERPLIPIKNTPFAASPDGYLIQYETNQDGKITFPLKVKDRFNIEIKCPLYEHRDDRAATLKAMKKKDSLIWYYAIQIHMEMMSQGVRKTKFVIWTKYQTNIFTSEFDDELWRKAYALLTAFKTNATCFDHINNLKNELRMECMRYAQKSKHTLAVLDEEASMAGL